MPRLDAAGRLATPPSPWFVKTIAKETAVSVHPGVVKGGSTALASRVDAAGAHNVAGTALDLIPKAESATTRSQLGHAVAVLTPHMPGTGEAAKVCAEAATPWREPSPRSPTPPPAQSSAWRWPPSRPAWAGEEAAKVCRRGGHPPWREPSPRSSNANVRSQLANAVGVLAQHLDTAGARAHRH